MDILLSLGYLLCNLSGQHEQEVLRYLYQKRLSTREAGQRLGLSTPDVRKSQCISDTRS